MCQLKTHGFALLITLAAAYRLGARAGAQRPDLSKPKVPIVIVVGCASRGPDGTWMLTNASDGKVSAIVHTDAKEIEDARKIPLGTNRYRLIGTAEFASVDELVNQGQRGQFTRKETANTTGQLQNGHKVSVKALLITAPNERRLNLLSVQSIADTCK